MQLSASSNKPEAVTVGIYPAHASRDWLSFYIQWTRKCSSLETALKNVKETWERKWDLEWASSDT